MVNRDDVLTFAEIKMKARRLSPAGVQKVLKRLDSEIELFEHYLGPHGDRMHGEPGQDSKDYLDRIKLMRKIVEEEGSLNYKPQDTL